MLGSLSIGALGCVPDAFTAVTPEESDGGEAAVGDQPGGAQASAAAGQPAAVEDASQAGAAGSEAVPTSVGESCSTSQDCDNGLLCDGEETCVAGACSAGEPLECDTHLTCSDAEGKCVFTDTSPWVVYQADDDTPGVAEVYAVKRDLVGKMEPVRLNDELTPGWSGAWTGEWAPDHQMYTFSVCQLSPYHCAIELVYFGHGLPGKARRLEGEALLWAPSRQAFAINGINGVSIYEYSGEGDYKQVFSAVGGSVPDCAPKWTIRDELVFAGTSPKTKKPGLQRALRDGSVWRATTLIEEVDLQQFEVRPDGTELVYRPHTDESSLPPLYVIQMEEGSEPQVLAKAGNHSFRWSPTGTGFLLLEGDAGATKAYLGGRAYNAVLMQLEPTKVVSYGDFTPNDRDILLWEPKGASGFDVKRLGYENEVGGGLVTSAATVGGLIWAADGDLGVTTSTESNSAEQALTAFSLNGRRPTETLDSIPSAGSYENVVVSAHSEFVAYKKGVFPKFDGAYVDLRYDSLGSHAPKRLPGEGSVDSLGFDSSGTGLYYVLEKASGAHECFYLDLSGQVAKPPVKISRDGRVEYCISQLVDR